MARTIPMEWKELQEARRVGIPESIIGKLGQGIEPSEKEKNIINKYGKEYVSVHTREGNRIKPHLRDFKCVIAPTNKVDRYVEGIIEGKALEVPNIYADEVIEKLKDRGHKVEITRRMGYTYVMLIDSVEKKKWVYGTRDEKWHLVSKEDRDYEHGISQEEFRRIGEEEARQKYLSPAIIRDTPRGFREKSKEVEIRTMYSRAVGEYNFDIPTEDSPYDEYLKDRIGAIGQDVQGTIDVLRRNRYSDNEIQDILDDLDIRGEARLPRPVKMEAEYFVYD